MPVDVPVLSVMMLIVTYMQDLSTGGISLRGSTTPATKQRSIVFVLGGPGSGKGTQVTVCNVPCAWTGKHAGLVAISSAPAPHNDCLFRTCTLVVDDSTISCGAQGASCLSNIGIVLLSLGDALRVHIWLCNVL